MKKIYFAFIVIFSFCAQGQDTLTKHKSKLRIGVFTSVDFNLAEKNYPTSAHSGFDAIYNHFNYSAGFTGEYLLTEKISFNTGLNYSNKHFTGLPYCHVCDYLIPPPPRTVRLQYFEIPISVRIYIPLNQVSFFTEVGAVNQFAQSKYYTLSENGYVLSGKLGAGIELNLSQSMAIQFGAEYLKGLTNLLNYINVKNESMGIRFGLVKSF